MSFENALGLSFSSDPSTMWTAFNKCKLYMEQGQRLEYMSWRRWHQERNKKSSADTHDAYPHEVSQQQQKCYDHHENNNKKENVSLLSRSSSFCHLESDNSHNNDHHSNDYHGDDHHSDYHSNHGDDDDDYYLSDDLYDDEEEMTDFHFVNEFKKTQPRPATPRRSLLSDLLQRVSPPSLLSNSSSSLSSTHHSSSILTLEDEYKHSSSPPAFNQLISNNKLPPPTNDLKWRESFHGW